MEKLVNVTIEQDNEYSLLQPKRFCYDFNVNNVNLDYCVIVPELELITVDFGKFGLDILGLEKGDFNSYETKFKEFGINLGEV